MPRFPHPLPGFVLAILFFFSFSPLSAQTTSDNPGGEVIGQRLDRIGSDVLLIKGVIQDDHKEPLERAQIMILDGEKVLGRGFANRKGKFSVRFPVTQILSDTLRIDIRYQRQSFSQTGILPYSQQLHIVLNHEQWLPEVEILASPDSWREYIICDYPIQPHSVRIHYIRPVWSPRYDTIEELIWMTNSEVYSDKY